MTTMPVSPLAETGDREMKAVSRGQALEISARVATQIKWDDLDGGSLQNEVIQLSAEEFGSRFTAFLRNGARIMVSVLRFVIIRGCFNPTEFIGQGWSIIADETDARSLALTELDLNKVHFVTMLEDGEYCFNGEDNLKRLKASGKIRLDVDVFYTLWGNKSLIPEWWKEKINGKTRLIFFDGTVLQEPFGSRYVLFLYWLDGAWHWDVRWLVSNRNEQCVSVILAS